jgi:hypothetical protein
MLMDRPQTLLSAHCSSQFMLEQALLYYVPGVSLKSIEDTNSASLKSIVHATTKNSRARTVLSSTAVDIYSFEYRGRLGYHTYILNYQVLILRRGIPYKATGQRGTQTAFFSRE